MNNTMTDIIRSEYKLRVITECLSRIKQCVLSLTHEEIWHRQNENTNSIGNLVLHLSGNIRQYIVCGIGDTPDDRVRDKEFARDRNESSAFILDLLTKTLEASNEVVQNLPEDSFTQPVTIQGFQHTTLSAIIHVIEHLSYHTGQITFYTKYIKNIDLSLIHI